jgi:flagellar M-ring protein FliF
MKNIWESMSSQARIGLGVGVLLILVLVGAVAKWSMTKDHEVLFADLDQQDAAAMVAELERLKQPYELAQGGTAIMVPPDAVARTRLKLVAKNLPAHGGVGFEIFNDTDYGMTEFAQKVNYQRALQGELTRTILALDEIQSARVHLALPEGSLFKRDDNPAKASVTLALKPGRTLEKEEIAGIQRLVAAAVPQMDPKDVTIVNSLGTALNALASQASADGSDWKLEAKRQVETYLDRKLTALIDKAVGKGRGAVTVDAELNLDNVKVTAEEVLPGGRVDAGDGDSSVMLRERVTSRPGAAASSTSAGTPDAVTNSDVEYAVGRRVQQVVSTPGSIKRLSVGVILPPEVGPMQVEQLRQLIGAAAGLDKVRGDTLAVYAAAPAPAAGTTPTQSPSADTPPPTGLAVDAQPQPRRPVFEMSTLPVLALILAVLAIAVIARYIARSRSGQTAFAQEGDGPARPLTHAQREKVLADVRVWLAKQVTA